MDLLTICTAIGSLAIWSAPLATKLLSFSLLAVISPPTYTAYLGESPATFSCFVANTSDDDDVYWQVDGRICQSDDELNARGISCEVNRTLPKFNLIISSKIENMNTSIQCHSGRLGTGGRFTIGVATFYVQGELLI